jgi:hypothetical protein
MIFYSAVCTVQYREREGKNKIYNTDQHWTTTKSCFVTIKSITISSLLPLPLPLSSL